MVKQSDFVDEIECPIKKKRKSKKSIKELSSLRQAWRVYLHE